MQKLSKAQKEALQLIRDGWRVLRFSYSNKMEVSKTLQIRHFPTEYRTVSRPTIDKLEELGLIVGTDTGGIIYYKEAPPKESPI